MHTARTRSATGPGSGALPLRRFAVSLSAGISLLFSPAIFSPRFGRPKLAPGLSSDFYK